jgi:hypothetical protein
MSKQLKKLAICEAARVLKDCRATVKKYECVGYLQVLTRLQMYEVFPSFPTRLHAVALRHREHLH